MSLSSEKHEEMSDQRPDRAPSDADFEEPDELEPDASAPLIRHATQPHNLGVLAEPDGEATLTGICEDTIRVQIELAGDRVARSRFLTNGCLYTVACASQATELIEGLPLVEALRLDGRRVIESLGGLPVEHTHCADLAANTVKAAARDALETRREPWKRAYRKR